MKHIKMYKVVFNDYYNTNYNEVASYKLDTSGCFVDESGINVSFGGDNYSVINIPNPFLIREDEIEKYKKYGCGYKSLDYVGSIIEED